MDEPNSDDRKIERLKLAPPSLKAAVRRARVENAERSEAVDDLRQAELMRLEVLLEAIRPVLDQTPDDVELFDAGVAHSDHPRLFLDMIAFADMAHDRRTYRFFQDSRHGRVLIAESAEVERMAAVMTNYIARRLVERERALEADARARPTRVFETKAGLQPRSPPRRRLLTIVADLLVFALTTLGAVTLLGLLALAAWHVWSVWGRALWTAQFGAPPF